MIAFLKGRFAVKTPAYVVIDVNGVGYGVQISLTTYSAIAEKETGLLHTYLHITENAQVLFGFAEEAEKEMFLQLISVSGVGAATARMMLSGMKINEIANAIVAGNVNQLSLIKGIGKKTAERIIVELKDKLQKHTINIVSDGSVASSTNTDAVDALMALGIAKNVAEQAVKKVIISNPSLSLENIIKLALKNL
ncbi:MAG: Holliday junction branch migration protein RuvA [Bacteroidetes bacterium]|nr:Holliday junction branch migration protein RuvA [Bacteroidota bacterium]MBS1648533.1 Holliday junction branch migration protein RuvA [Bacteroidota bacterium]